MGKRQGKAASRRQRQRSASRPAQRPAAPTMPARGPDALDASEPMTQTVATPTVQAAPSSPPVAGARPTRRGTQLIGGASRLTEQAAAEYHYVTADLRNIGVLFVVLLALLAVAFFMIEVLGIGRVAT